MKLRGRCGRTASLIVMARRRRGNNQPALRPFDVDGVRTVAIGTVMWAVAFVVLALFREELDEVGMGWWLWTCLAGVGLGLLGLEYTRKRRDAIARARLGEEEDRPDDDLAFVEPDHFNDELPESEPARADAEQAPIRAAGPEVVEAGPAPAHVEPEPFHAEIEPIRAEPEPVRAEFEPARAAFESIQAEPEPVEAEPEPAEGHPSTRPEPDLTEPEPHIAQWTEPGLLDDIGPPVPRPPDASRRARRTASDAEQTEYDDDEPLLPMAMDPRGTADRRATGGGHRARRSDPADEFDVDEGDAFYRGRRTRRP